MKNTLKYVVVYVLERDIYKVGCTDDPNEASQILKDDFLREFFDQYSEEDYEYRVGEGEEWELDGLSAWMNGSDGQNRDWAILEIS